MKAGQIEVWSNTPGFHVPSECFYWYVSNQHILKMPSFQHEDSKNLASMCHQILCPGDFNQIFMIPDFCDSVRVIGHKLLLLFLCIYSGTLIIWAPLAMWFSQVAK